MNDEQLTGSWLKVDDAHRNEMIVKGMLR